MSRSPQRCKKGGRVSPTPLIELQRRLSEAGRIRMGEKGPKGEPKRLSTWRLTSPDVGLIEQAAALYGGKPEPWESPTGGQFQLTTTTAELPVLVLVNYSLRQSYEYRTSPTLVERRCDGQEMDDGQPCKCAAEGEDKCDLITRLTVALPELTTLLGWRLESKGENAARELLGSLELVQGVAQGRPFVPAKLRIVERRGNVNGQAVRYVVPVLDCQVSYEQLAASTQPALERGSNGPDGYLPIPPRLVAAVGLKEALEAAPVPAARTARSAAPIPDGSDLEFVDQPVPVPDDTPGAKPSPRATPQQKKKLDVLVGTLREKGFVHTEHLYQAVAHMREIDADAVLIKVGTAEGGKVSWALLRDDLSKDEASNLIDRLDRFETTTAAIHEEAG
jgi:hypothetical protein